jgi:hypothetical protein
MGLEKKFNMKKVSMSKKQKGNLTKGIRTKMKQFESEWESENI